MENEKQVDPYIYKSNGYYLGFIQDGFLFDPNGVYIGWVDGKFVWDKSGFFRGVLTPMDNSKNYILSERFSIKPIPRSPKTIGNVVPLSPPSNINPINLPPNMGDGF
jgi:hypothetical protein